MRPRVTRTDAVVEAARRCIAERGFLGADIDDIAREAGVSRATVYRYAGGKSALIRDVLILECTELIGRVAAAVDAAVDGRDALRRLVATGLESLRLQPVLARATGPDLRAVLPTLTIDGGPLIGRCAQLLTPVLAGAQERGLLGPDFSPPAFAEHVVRFVLGLIHTPTLGADSRDPGAAAERALRLFGPAVLPRDPDRT